jgi:hypothetical protein
VANYHKTTQKGVTALEYATYPKSNITATFSSQTIIPQRLTTYVAAREKFPPSYSNQPNPNGGV